MKQLSVFAFLLFVIQSSFAGTNGSFLIKLKPGVNPLVYGAKNGVRLESLAPNGLYLAHPTTSTESTIQSLGKARSNPKVALAQPNHTVTLRKATPSSNDLNKQWNYRFDGSAFGVDAVGAWNEFGHKGTIPYGDEIVIAIVDGGFAPNHADLAGNIWVNKAEVAGNNTDDDGNGYIDDINGWDVQSETGTLIEEDHGTHVAGIIGAQGDNEINGAGINWKVKIMYVSAGWKLAETADTMRAYGYILKQKQLWLESDGKKGANVVAINSSFGIDRGDCSSSEYAVWNDMFNDLGKAGILSVAATANAGWNIDETGDIPTACNSPYLITVTNTDINGYRAEAGFGKTTIDLGAPGEEIYSTLPGNDFGSMSGTSMATPHVTGSVGYLFSVASLDFIDKYLGNPGEAILELKDIILRTVSIRGELQTETVSGGILNLAAASRAISGYAPRCTH